MAQPADPYPDGDIYFDDDRNLRTAHRNPGSSNRDGYNYAYPDAILYPFSDFHSIPDADGHHHADELTRSTYAYSDGN